MNNLRQVSDLSEVESLLSLVGDVQSRRLELHPDSLNGAGFGVFVMGTPQQALDCIERYHGSSALGRTLSVTAAKPNCFARAQSVPGKKKNIAR